MNQQLYSNVRVLVQYAASMVTLLAIVLSTASFSFAPSLAHAAGPLDVWWPTTSSVLSGVQPFKAMVEGVFVDQYEMYWQVDNGQQNHMDNNYTGYPHKEASVDLSSWHWKGSGPYTITFTEVQNGATVQTHSVAITIPQSGIPAPVSAPALTRTVSQPAVVAPTITRSVVSTLYVNPNSAAASQAAQWRSSRPADAQAMDVLAGQSTASWFGGWNQNISSDVSNLVGAAAAKGGTPVLVAYNIPGRDCGGYSQGGANSPDAYLSWVRSFASGIGSRRALVVLEPDALAGISCLSSGDQQTRLSLLAQAVGILKQNAGTAVYLDAGHAGWVDAGAMASLLQRANIASADGFALNVSNFMPTDSNVAYGTSISSLVGNKHFIVDTSRNGSGSNGQWCNPSGGAIGQKPTTQTGNVLVDAYLWIKTPGESDGSCNGGPSAGQWWADYALALVQNAH